MTREELYQYIPLDREIADKFIDYCFNKSYNGLYETLEELLEQLRVISFRKVLYNAFMWDKTPEGHDFWRSFLGDDLGEKITYEPAPSTADTIFELLDQLKSENREEYKEVLDLLYSKTMEELYLDSGVEHEH